MQHCRLLRQWTLAGGTAAAALLLRLLQMLLQVTALLAVMRETAAAATGSLQQWLPWSCFCLKWLLTSGMSCAAMPPQASLWQPGIGQHAMCLSRSCGSSSSSRGWVQHHQKQV
jgi:hypothetical protein